MTLLEVVNISKNFNHKPAVDNVSFVLDQGNILCLLGHSGCGKTTLLRIIAGLEQADSGRIIFDKKDMTAILPHLRNFGMMFQDFALFPHKNVFQNVAFGLDVRGDNPDLRVKEMLTLVGLEGFAKRNIRELSGGERQRAALARSLAPSPRLLMLDEPLGSLDQSLRERLMRDLRKILKKIGMTAIFVTHDQSEAFAVADQIAVIHKGRIIQIDSPENLFKYPANTLIANFLGFHNFIKGRVLSDKGVHTEIGIFYPELPEDLKPQDNITLLLRPEPVRIAKKSRLNNEKHIIITGRVRELIFQGPVYKITLQTDSGIELIFNLSSTVPRPVKDNVIRLTLPLSSLVYIQDA